MIGILLAIIISRPAAAKFLCVEQALPQPSAEQVASAKSCESNIAGSKALTPLLQLNVTKKNECVAYLKSKHYEEKIKAKKATLDNAADDWNDCLGSQFYEEKVRAIYAAANEYNLSPIVLAGAILQESSAGDLGIGRDFDNWTCGPSQFSVLAWCDWARSLSPKAQATIGWPSDLVKNFQQQNPSIDICAENSFLYREQARPFLEIGLKRMKADINSDMEFMLESKYMVEPNPIRFEDTANSFTALSKAHGVLLAGDPAAERLRFEMTKSFVENCSDHNQAFRAMAFALRRTFESLPKELQEAQMLPNIKDKNPLYDQCKAKVTTKAYPLSVGWLIADAIYNAGPSLLTGILEYQKNSKINWSNFQAKDLLNAINYALTPKFGMSGIGAEEAKNHIRGLLRNVGAI